MAINFTSFDPRDQAKHSKAKAKFERETDELQEAKTAEPSTLISIRIPNRVLEHFKSQGPGYQTRINEALLAMVRK